MLLNCELMLLKSHIHKNTNKNGFLIPTKYLEWVLKYSYLVSIILNHQFPKTMFADLCVLILIALAHTLIALTHLNSTEKMHRLHYIPGPFHHLSSNEGSRIAKRKERKR